MSTLMESCQPTKKTATRQNKHLLPESASTHDSEHETQKRPRRSADASCSRDRFLAVSALLIHCSSFMNTSATSSLRLVCRAMLLLSHRFMPMLMSAARDELIAWPCAKFTRLDSLSDFLWANRVGRLAYSQEIFVWDEDHTDFQNMAYLSPMPRLLRLSINLVPNVFSAFSHALVNIQELYLEIFNPSRECTGDASNTQPHILDLSRCCHLRNMSILDNSSQYALDIVGLRDIRSLEHARLQLYDRDYSRLLENKPNLTTLMLKMWSSSSRPAKVLPMDHRHVSNLIMFDGWDGETAIPPSVRTLVLCVPNYSARSHIPHVCIPLHVSDLTVTTLIDISLDLSQVKSTLISLQVCFNGIMDLDMPTPMTRLQVLHMSGSLDFRCFESMPELRELELQDCEVGLTSSSSDVRARCFRTLTRLRSVSVLWMTMQTPILIGWDDVLVSLACLPHLEKVSLDVRLPHETAFCGSLESSSQALQPIHLTLVGWAGTMMVDSVADLETAKNTVGTLRATSFARVGRLTLKDICVVPNRLSNLGVAQLSLQNVLLLYDDVANAWLLDSADIQFPQESDDWITSLQSKATPALKK